MRQNSRLFFIKPSLLLLIIAVAGFIFGSSFFTKRATGETSAFAPNLSATKAAALDTSAGGDLNGNGIVNPGDRLTYTVTIQNNGDQPATGVNFSDTIDANTTYQAGSMIASPVAVNDVYSSIGNVGINVTDGAGDLLGNDFDANSPAVPNLTISNVNTAGTQGAVNVNTATGSFTFNPNPGFEGPTTFSYTLSNGTGLTDTATVTINVSGMIWFVNAAAGSGGDGRLSSPFNCFVGTNCFDDATGDEAGDNIFLYSGSYTGGQTLLTNQRLIGQGATTALTGAGSITGIIVPPFSNALPSTGGTNPNVTTSAAATNGINIVSGNTVRGLSVTTTTGAGISGANVTNATIGADVSISGASGAAFELGGNASGTIGFGAGVTNTSGRAISIQNRTGGTVDLRQRRNGNFAQR